MDEMQKMTFCVFMSHEHQKPFLGIFIFIMGVAPSNFVVVSFLLTFFTKGLFTGGNLGNCHEIVIT